MSFLGTQGLRVLWRGRDPGARALSSWAPPTQVSEPSTLRPLSPPDHGRRRRAVRGCVRAVRGDRQVSLHARERECGKMHFSDARGLPHRLRACPLPSLPLLCLPCPLHPVVFIDVYLDLLPGEGLGALSNPWRPASPGRPPHKAWGGLPAFYLTVTQGRGRTDFIVAYWEQLGLLLPFLYLRPFTKTAACISCACVERARECVQGF